MSKKKGALREWIEAIIVAGALAVFLRTFFFQLYKIPTTSMVPTLEPRDKIFVVKLTYGPKIPIINVNLPKLVKLKKTDIFVFVPPPEKEKYWFKRKQYIKRLIGKEGDRILIKEGNIYLNGKIVVEPQIARNYYYNQGEYAKLNQEIVVPKGKYFFLGDNSISSFDGRFWGFVEEEDIIGRAVFIWWPPKRIGIIE